MRRIIISCAMAVISASSTQAASWEVFPKLDQNSARRGTIADHPQTIILAEKSGAEKRDEFADSLTGGPDFWDVTRAAAEGLSLREEPTPHAKLVTHFPNGTVLKNLGCKNRRGKRWCKVERLNVPSVRGWVNGRYLRESAGAN